jgi:hypothetical protein
VMEQPPFVKHGTAPAPGAVPAARTVPATGTATAG